MDFPTTSITVKLVCPECKATEAISLECMLRDCLGCETCGGVRDLAEAVAVDVGQLTHLMDRHGRISCSTREEP